MWCDDITNTTSPCILPVGMSLREAFARVIAVRVAVVPRTRRHRRERDSGGGDLTVFNHTFQGTNDGYRRWIYRATVALRNNEL
ncbi:MAG: PilW family protein [Myxococcota bacterium]